MTKCATLACVFLVLASSFSNADTNREIFDKVHSLFNHPENEIDIAKSKLIIDQIIDPAIDIDKELERLDRIVEDIYRLSSPSTSSEKVAALRRYLYEAGSWNMYKPVTYDFNDPKGTLIHNKLLPNYLDSRRGNCISMPSLFISLGQKMGIDVTASTAPLHMFVKYTDSENGITYNLETTSGANPARDEWLRKGFPMSDLAIEKGTYLAKLTRKETVAFMLDTLLQHYKEKENYEMLISLSNLTLKYYPKAVNAVIYKASGFNGLLKQKGLWRYREPKDVPPNRRNEFIYLVSNSNKTYEKALNMGWRQPSPEEEQAYDKSMIENSAQ